MSNEESKGAKKRTKSRNKPKLARLIKNQRHLRLGSKTVFSRQRLGMMFKRSIRAIGFSPKAHGKDNSAVLALSAILRQHGSKVVDMANMTIVAGGTGIVITPKRVQSVIQHYVRENPMTPAHDWSSLRRPKKSDL